MSPLRTKDNASRTPRGPNKRPASKEWNPYDIVNNERQRKNDETKCKRAIKDLEKKYDNAKLSKEDFMLEYVRLRYCRDLRHNRAAGLDIIDRALPDLKVSDEGRNFAAYCLDQCNGDHTIRFERGRTTPLPVQAASIAQPMNDQCAANLIMHPPMQQAAFNNGCLGNAGPSTAFTAANFQVSSYGYPSSLQCQNVNQPFSNFGHAAQMANGAAAGINDVSQAQKGFDGQRAPFTTGVYNGQNTAATNGTSKDTTAEDHLALYSERLDRHLLPKFNNGSNWQNAAQFEFGATAGTAGPTQFQAEANNDGDAIEELLNSFGMNQTKGSDASSPNYLAGANGYAQPLAPINAADQYPLDFEQEQPAPPGRNALLEPLENLSAFEMEPIDQELLAMASKEPQQQTANAFEYAPAISGTFTAQVPFRTRPHDARQQSINPPAPASNGFNPSALQDLPQQAANMFDYERIAAGSFPFEADDLAQQTDSSSARVPDALSPSALQDFAQQVEDTFGYEPAAPDAFNAATPFTSEADDFARDTVAPSALMLGAPGPSAPQEPPQQTVNPSDLVLNAQPDAPDQQWDNADEDENEDMGEQGSYGSSSRLAFSAGDGEGSSRYSRLGRVVL